MKAFAYEFSSEVDRQIEALSNTDYHRKFERSKKLREELHPLSRLALHFKQPGLEVEVEGFEDNGRPDGHIRITGFREKEFEVQITYAHSYEAALRAELFVQEGCCPGAGEIKRDKRSRKIEAVAGLVAPNEHIDRIASTVLERFRNKVGKPYAQGTVLLIAFDEWKLCGRTNWNQLFSAIDKEGGISGSQFAEVYLFNGATNELHRAA